MDHAEWFRHHLKAGADGVVWAVEQTPSHRLFATPPRELGHWPAARHLFHLYYYDREIALPSMKQWLGQPLPTLEGHNEESAWRRGHEPKDLLEQFQATREQQISLLSEFDEDAWTRSCETIWGLTTLLWVVGKTYQHTAEHISDILSIALFWDHLSA